MVHRVPNSVQSMAIQSILLELTYSLLKIYRFRFMKFRFRINPLLNKHRSISSWHEISSMYNISVSVLSWCIFELFIIDFWFEFRIGIVFCICSKNVVIIYEHRPNSHNIYLSHSKITNQRQMRFYSYVDRI